MAPLPQSAGYGIVVGLGFAFCFGMMLITYLLKRYKKQYMTSEEFSTAGRSVKTGLIGSAVVSSWTWAATLLQSTTVTYEYGVSGAFWYAAGACVQIILFATIAIELKRKAPNAHTFLEVIRARYGPVGHIVFMVFGMFCNILVTVQLLAGGSATISYLTGMSPVACCFLLPLSVGIYTVFGGLKSTIITDWIHTFILIIIIFIFAFTAFASSNIIGSPSKMYDLLTAQAELYPIDGNAMGSFLTLRSQQGAIFFVINLVGNFGTVYLDSGYWNKAIASHPGAALPGYIFGGLAWFAIPFLCATTMGLTGLALKGTEHFATLSAAEVSAGLVLPNSAVALLGKSGAMCALIMLFMAVTSATSSELIAVSTIMTYDVYKAYINPNASSRTLITVSHIGVVVYGLAMAVFAVGLHYAGVSMGYLYLLMGVIISSAVIPAILSILWSQMNLYAAVLSPILGLACSLIAWLVTCRVKFDNVLNVTTTGSNDPMLAGNVVALLSPVVFVPFFTYVFGKANYDWKSMKMIRADHIDDDDTTDSSESDDNGEVGERVAAIQEQSLKRAALIARIVCVVLAISFIIVWPMPMYGTSYVFSKKFFTGWIVVGFIWLFYTLFFVGLFPIYQGLSSIRRVCMGIFGDVTGKPVAMESPVEEDVDVKEKMDEIVREKEVDA
uniref:ARAD1D16852p n=1 Tax=Blastobotrys adeninivorans TaxID=409370 RepID=A0A060T9S5_BLAAD